MPLQETVSVTLKVDHGTLTPDLLSPTAGQEIPVYKLRHLHKGFTDFGFATTAQPSGTVRKTILRAENAGTLRFPKASLEDTGTSTSIAFTVYKNSASITDTAATITHATTDGASVDVTLSDDAVVEDDVIDVEMVVTSNTGALGPFFTIECDETADATT